MLFYIMQIVSDADRGCKHVVDEDCLDADSRQRVDTALA